MSLGLGLLVVALLAALGMPLFAVILAVALLGFHLAGYDLIIVAVEVYRLGDLPGLVAIPLFTLAGYLLGESGAPRRLVRLSNALLGWLPGGLAIVAIVACAFFTAFTGASGVTIVALGALLYPALRQAGGVTLHRAALGSQPVPGFGGRVAHLAREAGQALFHYCRAPNPNPLPEAVLERALKPWVGGVHW